VFNNNAGFWWFADKILSSLSCLAGDNETGRKPAQLLTQDRWGNIFRNAVQMKNILTFTLLILIINSCFGQDYSIESKHFDCLVKTAAELGIDLKKELSNFEEHLIKTGVLAGNSGESYYKIYEIIKETGDIDFVFQYSLLDSVKSSIDNVEFSGLSSDCLRLAEKTQKSRKFKRSKLFQLKIGMDSITNSGDINVSNVTAVILRILNPRDFEHEYYKMTALLMLATTQDIDSGLIRKLPSVSDSNDKEPVDKRNLLIMYVTTDNDSVKLNNAKVSIEDLTEIVESYIISDSKDTTMPELTSIDIDLIGNCFQSKLIISLQNDRETSYSTYIKVQDKLTNAYKKVRNDKAVEFFDLEFDKLSTEQKNSIREMIPMRISEAEPNQ